MAVGAALGTVLGQVIDASSGGAEPSFAAAIGAALGAALGRSTWIRVGIARQRGVAPALALGVLAARIAGCVLVGIALVGSLSGPSAGAVRLAAPARLALFLGGAALLVGTAVAEQRWTRRPDLRTIPPGRDTHGA